MKIFNIKQVLISITKEDLIEYGFFESDNLALVRLRASELSKIISKVVNNEYIEIIDFSYNGITNNEINYEMEINFEGKFLIKDNK